VPGVALGSNPATRLTPGREAALVNYIAVTSVNCSTLACVTSRFLVISHCMMVKPLSFKGDKKSSKKRKRLPEVDDESAPQTNEVATSKAEETDDDSWVNAEAAVDITGPIVFVLPTDDASALACDVTGRVFILPLENMVDNDPQTAEPHDIRMVWVANRVAGSEKFSFKSHHGRYLGCDKFGILSATREAVSPEESFQCIAVANNPGAFIVQTERQLFFTIDPKAKEPHKIARGDGEGIDFNSSWRIRMQARFKPKIKIAKATKAREKITRQELDELVGRRLGEEDVKKLKRAKREGNFHEALLDVKVKGKHDKFA